MVLLLVLVLLLHMNQGGVFQEQYLSHKSKHRRHHDSM